MPVVSLFYGIKISFYYDDNNPPHFHAAYAGNKALVDILNCAVIKSALPKKQLELAKCNAELIQIEPLR